MEQINGINQNNDNYDIDEILQSPAVGSGEHHGSYEAAVAE